MFNPDLMGSVAGEQQADRLREADYARALANVRQPYRMRLRFVTVTLSLLLTFLSA